MKHTLIILFCFLYYNLLALNIEMSLYNYYGAQPYTELYLRIDGSSIEWNAQKEASVNILLIVTDDTGNIAAYDKFDLKTTARDSISDLLDVKRFKLMPGVYQVKLEAIDNFKPVNKVEMEQKWTISKALDGFNISDILPLSVIKRDSSSNSLVKNGLYMEPLSYHYSAPIDNQMDFYLEVYQDDVSDSEYYIQYTIMEGNTQNLTAKALLSKYKKLGKGLVLPEVFSLPVNAIKSGDYHILVNIINKDKTVVASRSTDFIKSNPEADITYLESFDPVADQSFVQKIKVEDMDFVLKAHLPITDQHQVSTLGELIKSNKIKSQRQFIYQLWKAKSPANPEFAYNGYMDVAAAVDKKFYTNVGYGFQSDRGHIFLKYGKPSNVLTVESEVDAPPYEIWYYNNMAQTGQTNVRFLFYNPSLAHNDYKLLHSTCLGEKVNPSWEVELYKSVPNDRQGNTVDATRVNENWNRNARRYFNEY
ncbi:MAG: GWxTD domain-containing protein [Saprospiraceae bacterium]|nr:GWxTD domain-containing protein [Saprospiraceae bacterium]